MSAGPWRMLPARDAAATRHHVNHHPLVPGSSVQGLLVLLHLVPWLQPCCCQLLLMPSASPGCFTASVLAVVSTLGDLDVWNDSSALSASNERKKASSLLYIVPLQGFAHVQGGYSSGTDFLIKYIAEFSFASDHSFKDLQDLPSLHQICHASWSTVWHHSWGLVLEEECHQHPDQLAAGHVCFPHWGWQGALQSALKPHRAPMPDLQPQGPVLGPVHSGFPCCQHLCWV